MADTQADREAALANQALIELGDQPVIEALTEASDKAERANAVYATIRDALLEQHPWKFALARAEIDEDGAAPAFGWLRRFALPDDYLKAWRLNDKDELRVRWTVERGFLLTDESSPIRLRYIAATPDPGDWTPAFKRAVITELAATLALGITNTRVSHETLTKAARDRLDTARWVDGKEEGAHEWLPGRLARRRWSVSG